MTTVAVHRSSKLSYPEQIPFHPSTAFPEIAKAGIPLGPEQNSAYAAVREVLMLLGLDRQSADTPAWNPLGAYIRHGDRVVIKPNFVLHEFGPQKNAHCLTTHGSIIRAVLDYVYLATGPEGTITIADAPLQGANFERIVSDAGLAQIQEFYRQKFKFEIKIVDLRQVHAVIDEDSSLIRRVERLPGDPNGYCEIDLGSASRLRDVDAAKARYVVGDYDAAVTNMRHGSARHSYVVSRSVLDADAIICVPKLKTHSKAGITVCLKNMVGIIGSKDCLPHHRFGKSDQGGDEFPADYPIRWQVSGRAHDILQGRVPAPIWKTLRRLAKAWLGAGTPHNGAGESSTFFPSGGWHGNDTIWRTVDDLNRILFFYSPEEQAMQLEPQRRYFAIVDGITAMEGNGPLRGTPRPAGTILGGDDPLAIDVAAATLMGFDWQRIRLLKGIAESHSEPRYSTVAGDSSSIELRSNVSNLNSLEDLRHNHLSFRAPNGWLQAVELEHVA